MRASFVLPALSTREVASTLRRARNVPWPTVDFEVRQVRPRAFPSGSGKSSVSNSTRSSQQPSTRHQRSSTSMRARPNTTRRSPRRRFLDVRKRRRPNMWRIRPSHTSIYPSRLNQHRSGLQRPPLPPQPRASQLNHERPLGLSPKYLLRSRPRPRLRPPPRTSQPQLYPKRRICQRPTFRSIRLQRRMPKTLRQLQRPAQPTFWPS